MTPPHDIPAYISAGERETAGQRIEQSHDLADAALRSETMVVAMPEDAGGAPLVPHTDDEQPPQDLSAIGPARRDGSLPVAAPQCNNKVNNISTNRRTFVDLDSVMYERAVPVPTRRGLASSPALFLWESRTTNVDVMSVSNTTRPVVVSRYGQGYFTYVQQYQRCMTKHGVRRIAPE